MYNNKMDNPRNYDEIIYKIIAVIFAASITGLLSKEPLLTKLKNLVAGLLGGGIVIIFSMGYPVQPWWVLPGCVIVSAFISTFWHDIGGWIVAIINAVGQKYFNKVKKNDAL